MARRRAPSIVAAGAGALVWAASDAAWACPACYSAGGDGVLAYFWTALLLSILPLAMIGGLILTVRRRVRAHRLSTPAASAPPTRIDPAGP